jgi:hypothetical protein
LRRAYGKWPSAGYQAMSMGERASFWSSLQNLEGKKLIQTAEETLVQYETSTEQFYDRVRTSALHG